MRAEGREGVVWRARTRFRYVLRWRTVAGMERRTMASLGKEMARRKDGERPCASLTARRSSGFDCNVPFSRRRLPIFGVVGATTIKTCQTVVYRYNIFHLQSFLVFVFFFLSLLKIALLHSHPTLNLTVVFPVVEMWRRTDIAVLVVSLNAFLTTQAANNLYLGSLLILCSC